MRFTKTCAVSVMLLVSVVLLGSVVGFAGTVSAQDNSGNPTILKVLADLQAQITTLQNGGNSLQNSVNLLQNSVNSLQNGVNSLQAGEQVNYRVTPPVFFGAASLFCNAANVSAAPRTVRLEIITRQGTTLEGLQTQTLQPGTSSIFTGIGLGVYQGYVSCRFTVTNGTKADIRGALTMLDAADNTLVTEHAE